MLLTGIRVPWVAGYMRPYDVRVPGPLHGFYLKPLLCAGMRLVKITAIYTPGTPSLPYNRQFEIHPHLLNMGVIYRKSMLPEVIEIPARSHQIGHDTWTIYGI